MVMDLHNDGSQCYFSIVCILLQYFFIFFVSYKSTVPNPYNSLSSVIVPHVYTVCFLHSARLPIPSSHGGSGGVQRGTLKRKRAHRLQYVSGSRASPTHPSLWRVSSNTPFSHAHTSSPSDKRSPSSPGCCNMHASRPHHTEPVQHVARASCK